VVFILFLLVTPLVTEGLAELIAAALLTVSGIPVYLVFVVAHAHGWLPAGPYRQWGGQFKLYLG
jgi:hypothetical protein